MCVFDCEQDTINIDKLFVFKATGSICTQTRLIVAVIFFAPFSMCGNWSLISFILLQPPRCDLK